MNSELTAGPPSRTASGGSPPAIAVASFVGRSGPGTSTTSIFTPLPDWLNRSRIFWNASCCGGWLNQKVPVPLALAAGWAGAAFSAGLSAAFGAAVGLVEDAPPLGAEAGGLLAQAATRIAAVPPVRDWRKCRRPKLPAIMPLLARRRVSLRSRPNQRRAGA